jgi:hypothetical protein
MGIKMGRKYGFYLLCVAAGLLALGLMLGKDAEGSGFTLRAGLLVAAGTIGFFGLTLALFQRLTLGPWLSIDLADPQHPALDMGPPGFRFRIHDKPMKGGLKIGRAYVFISWMTRLTLEASIALAAYGGLRPQGMSAGVTAGVLVFVGLIAGERMLYASRGYDPKAGEASADAASGEAEPARAGEPESEV